MIAYLIDGRSHMQVQKEAKRLFIQLGIYFMTFFLDWNPPLPSSSKTIHFKWSWLWSGWTRLPRDHTIMISDVGHYKVN